MKFSFVGHLTWALPLLQQVHASAEHSLGPCHVTGELATALAASRLPIQQEASPENAFLTPGVDVVVLALEDPDTVLQLTRAASQSERHVIVFPPAQASTAFGFELHLLLDESSRAILPVTGRLRLAEDLLPCSAATVAGIPSLLSAQQIVAELSLPTQDPVLLRREQQAALDCIVALGLRYSQVTALESTATTGALISRLLTLGTAAGSEQILPPATITVKTRPAAAEQSLVALDQPPVSSAPLTLQMIGMDGSQRSLAVTDVPALPGRIAAVCADRSLCLQLMDGYCTTLELSDAVDKSLRRRRTVDVYFDSGSERGVFKSQMTAIGCGVLTWLLLGMVAFLIVAQLFDLPPVVLQIGRAVWIAPVVLFLLAQLLLPLARDRSSR